MPTVVKIIIRDTFTKKLIALKLKEETLLSRVIEILRKRYEHLQQYEVALFLRGEELPLQISLKSLVEERGYTEKEKIEIRESAVNSAPKDYVKMMSEGGEQFNQAMVDILIQRKVLHEEAAVNALESARNKNTSSVNIIIEEAYLSEKDFLTNVSRYLEIASVDLDGVNIPPQVLGMIPQREAEYYCVLPVRLERNILAVAIPNPFDSQKLHDLKLLTGFDIDPLLSTEVSIKNKIKTLYQPAKNEQEDSPLPDELFSVDEDAKRKKRSTLMIKDGKKVSSVEIEEEEFEAPTLCSDKSDEFLPVESEEMPQVSLPVDDKIWDAPTLVGKKGGDFFSKNIDEIQFEEGIQLGEGAEDFGISLSGNDEDQKDADAVGIAIGSEEDADAVGIAIGSEEDADAVGITIGNEEDADAVGIAIGSEEDADAVGITIGNEEDADAVGIAIGSEEDADAVGQQEKSSPATFANTDAIVTKKTSAEDIQRPLEAEEEEDNISMGGEIPVFAGLHPDEVPEAIEIYSDSQGEIDRESMEKISMEDDDEPLTDYMKTERVHLQDKSLAATTEKPEEELEKELEKEIGISAEELELEEAVRTEKIDVGKLPVHMRQPIVPETLDLSDNLLAETKSEPISDGLEIPAESGQFMAEGLEIPSAFGDSEVKEKTEDAAEPKAIEADQTVQTESAIEAEEPEQQEVEETKQEAEAKETEPQPVETKVETEHQETKAETERQETKAETEHQETKAETEHQETKAETEQEEPELQPAEAKTEEAEQLEAKAETKEKKQVEKEQTQEPPSTDFLTTQKMGTKEAEKPIVLAEKLTMSVKLNHYAKMYAFRNYPLDIEFSAKRQKKNEGKELFLSMKVLIPGCLTVPQQTSLDLTSGTANTRVWVTPNCQDKIENARIEFYSSDKKVHNIDLSLKLTNQRPSIRLLKLAIVLPILGFICRFFGKDLIAGAPLQVLNLVDQLSMYTKHTHGIFNMSIIIAIVLFVITVLVTVMRKPSKVESSSCQFKYRR